MNRGQDITVFLEQSGWQDAAQLPLAGDASSRRYLRLKRGSQSRIMMDAPPQSCGSSQMFITIATHLRSAGFNAPEIFDTDVRQGLILMEDFGDALIANVLAADPAREHELYAAVIDVLARLNTCPWPDRLTPKSPAKLAEMASLIFAHYAPDVHAEDQRAALALLEKHLNATMDLPPALALRDFHAENLIWLPGQTPRMRIGLLDFQDAIVTHPAYDLVSLLKDARRDVSSDVEEAMITRFIDQTGLDEARLRHGYAVMGLQRNLRILGVFCRLASARAKPHYLSLLPRVWGHVQDALSTPALIDLKAAFACLPTPEDR
ncbi:aminoglycoside phosphotransferase family protein [Primorskyibacter sp. S187A]|uniref:aminoglycoside phosphotransferase family protein n=1 Tax=Primorskyibacter sp. S187A TaxID=3415130 RepID=UPI003C7A1527